MRWRRQAEPVDVLVVCTGNLCRSPIGHVLLATARPELTVASAGTAAPRGARQWHELSRAVLAEEGLPAEGAPRRLSAADVRGARLILTAEGAHRAEVVRLDPTAEERTYTLLEAARLLADPAINGLGVDGTVAELAKRLRAQRTEHDDDLADPIHGDITAFRTCRAQVADSVGVISAALNGPAPR